MKITASSKIIIQGASEPMRQAIIKKLTLVNPNFFKMKKMGHWISPDKQWFRYYEQPDPDTLIVPRGLLGRIIKFFPDVEVEEHFQNRQISTDLPHIQLRDYQNDIMARFRSQSLSEGIFCLSMGSGKSIIALEVIRGLKLTATILVNTKIIQDQFVEEAKKHLKYDVGIINGDEKSIKEITVANVASLYDNPELMKQLVENTSILIVDECSTFLSEERIKVIEQFNPKYVFGLTATPDRTDGQGPAIPFYFGNIIEDYSETMIKPTVEVIDSREFIPVCVNYNEMVDHQISNVSRNTLIAGIAVAEAIAGKKILILTKRCEHYQTIRALLPDWPGIIMAESGNKDLGVQLNLLREGKRDFSIILGTFSLLGTGFSIDRLDCLIVAGDLRSTVLTTQSAGRILRLLKDKNAIIYDIYDSQNGIFRRQFLERKKLYESRGWEIKGLEHWKR